MAGVKNPPAIAVNAEEEGSLSQEDPLEKEMVTFQCSCLENPMDRGAWWAPWDCKDSDMT